MNYRHAFHAGNFADVFKHVVLTRILVHLCKKPGPFRVIDTHAGAGLHDLTGGEANRTGEWRDGIGRLAAAADAATNDASLAPPAAELLAPYLAACRADPGLPRYYPGSPLIALRLMRPQDRLIACEVEPAAAATLARCLESPAPSRRRTEAGPVPRALISPTPDWPSATRRDRAAAGGRPKVLALDGWTALAAYVPPKERRGLVLVDPPYERTDEFAHLADALVAAHRKWPTGIYMLWYPIKSRDGPDHLLRALRSVAAEKRLRAEIATGAAEPQSGLSACGLIVLNPPWRLASELAVILPALVGVLGHSDDRGYVIDRLEGEPRYRSLDNRVSRG
jgi:23S rRNA (adenine2030-N6)-methyltransferase